MIARLRSLWIALAVVLTAAAWSGGAAAALKFPALTGRVVDQANVLSPEVEAGLTQKLAALEMANGRQLVVVTLSSLQGTDIEDYGYQLGRAWGIGQKSSNNGVLFIVAPAEHKVRIEVGYGLEPVLTDALSAIILQNQVLPRFRSGDVQGGVVAGTDALIEQLGLDPATAQARAQAAVAPPRHAASDPIGGVVVLFVILFIVSMVFRGGGLGMLPFLFLGGMGGRGGGWSDGGGGGGGFSGGGGSFGGGGSSGSW